MLDLFLLQLLFATQLHKINTQNVNAHLLKLFFWGALYILKECFYLVGNAKKPHSQFYFLTRVLTSFSREHFSCCAISTIISNVIIHFFVLFFLHPRSFFHHSFSSRALQQEKIRFRLSCDGLIH